MQQPQFKAPRVAGFICALFGATAAASWLVPIDLVERVIPTMSRMAIVNPLLFMAIGVCFFESTRPRPLTGGGARRRVFTACVAGLIALPSAYLFESATDISLGIDIVRHGITATPDYPRPGRLSLNSSVAFLCTGLAFWLFGKTSGRWRKAAFLAATSVVAAISLAGLAGHFIGLETLYKIADFNRMLPTTAFGLTVAAAGLWKLQEEAQEFDTARARVRIDRRSLAVVVLVALTCGVAGFAAMRSVFEESVSKNMLLSASTNATSLAHSIDLKLLLPRLVATRASVTDSLDKLSRNDASATDLLDKLADSFVGAELTGIEFHDARGRLAAAAGSMARSDARVVSALRNAGQAAWLVWDGGFVLLAEIDVLHNGRVVGRVLTEQRLPLFDQLLDQVRSDGSGSDATICSRDGADVVCAPTPLMPAGLRHAMFDGNGDPALPVVKALQGERSVMFGKDFDGDNVLFAVAPLKDLGIAYAARADRDVLYAPLRPRLAYLLLAVVAIISLGVYVQRSQVQPVLARLVQSERKLKGILEEQSELVALAGTDGMLRYVNPAFARFFGVVPERISQTSLADRVHPHDRGAFADLMASALHTATPVKIENRVLLPDGSERWVAWTSKLQRDDDGRCLLHFVGRDVTQRRRSEQRVAESERFVRQVTDNLPVCIAYVDRDLRYRFVNRAQAERLGRPREQVVGRTRAELTSRPADPRIEAAVAAVLQGKMQRLEHDEQVDGTVARVECQLIPDVADDGRVQGFYTTSIDITERAAAERALRDLAMIFDNTTDWVVQTDRPGNILYMNPAARAALEIGPDAPVSDRNYAEFSTLESSRLFAEVIVPESRAKGIWVGETTIGAGADRIVPVNMMLIAHREVDGEVRRFSAIMRDISLEYAVRQHRKRQTAILRSVTEAIPAPIAVVDRDERFRFVNSSFERWIGTRRDDIVGRVLCDVLGKRDYQELNPWAQRALGGETVSFEKDFTGRGGARRHLALSFVPLWLEGGAIDGFAVVGQDITHHKVQESKLLQLTLRDALTGLLNRAGFEHFLESRFGDAEAVASLALLCIDLDYFKPVNDTYGHPAGDSVLRQFSSRMTSNVRPTDAVARIGGDEFAIVLTGIREKAHAHLVAEKVIAAAHAPFKVDEHMVSIGASIGIAFGDDAGGGWQELVARADAVLYSAKAGGRGRYAGTS